ncbi:MAG TPA: hypothetical protein VJ972_00135, partial [Anaerolineales bacterium]|nr:hypothetical protein [Anaerolineales bacterium]
LLAGIGTPTPPGGFYQPTAGGGNNDGNGGGGGGVAPTQHVPPGQVKTDKPDNPNKPPTKDKKNNNK